MSEERLFSFANRWFSTSVGLVIAIFLVSILLGFVVLPYAEPQSRLGGLWQTICSAAGFPARPSEAEAIAPRFSRLDGRLRDAHASQSACGLHRSRRDARAAMRHLSWTDGRQPGGFPEPRGTVCCDHLQAASRLKDWGAVQTLR